jgi:hypothetical protein
MLDTITNSDAKYAYDIVTKICVEVGPGLPGSSQEWERAAMVRRELESHLGPENVFVEEFTFAPRGFLGSLPVSAVFMLVAVLLNVSLGRFTGISPWLTAFPALVLSILSILLIMCEFILGFELIDPLCPKKKSINVIGRLLPPATKSPKRLLILGGHHDSAPENTWLRFLGFGLMLASAIWCLGLIVMLAMSIIQLAGLIVEDAGIVRTGTVGWLVLVFPILPSIIYAMFFTRGWKGGGVVPGAVDNLSACALGVAMCRFLVKNPSYIPPDTEIRFISFGSEEAGVRGSRRYVRRHLEELKRLDAQLLNFEMVAHPEIAIIAADVNGTVKNSPEMVISVIAAAERAGVPYKVQPALYGGCGTDAAPFSQAGLKATTLVPFKMPEQLVAFYHQKWDTPEVLTLEPLLNVMKLTFEWIRCSRE